MGNAQDIPTLTVLINFDLIAPIDDVRRGIRSLAQRVQAEGGAGITGYRFYVNDTRRTARAVVDYTSAQAWIAYHDHAMTWPEMKQWRAVARMADVTFLGELSPAITSWMAANGMTVPAQSGYDLAAGFLRN